MAQLTEDLITSTAATLIFLPYRALICYLAHLPKEVVPPYHFSCATWQYVLCFRVLSQNGTDSEEFVFIQNWCCAHIFFSHLKKDLSLCIFFICLCFMHFSTKQQKRLSKPATPIVSGFWSQSVYFPKKPHMKWWNYLYKMPWLLPKHLFLTCGDWAEIWCGHCDSGCWILSLWV